MMEQSMVATEAGKNGLDAPGESAELGEFLGIGVGPGTGGLIPVAAVAALREADLILVPRARGAAESVARTSLAALELPAERFREIEFLMDPDRSVLREHYAQLAAQVIAELRAGRRVAYLTIGDTLTYSTYGYLLAALRDMEPALRHRTFRDGEYLASMRGCRSCARQQARRNSRGWN